MGTLLSQSQAVPAMQPLAASHAADAIEAELKALFIRLFNDLIRRQERRINALGMPHVGDFSLIERSIKQDGLAMFRGADQGAMRYLHKAWRARNPRRGLGFIRTYLQLLFPGNFAIIQQWHAKDQPYPSALSDNDGGNHFFTSRVSIRLTAPNAVSVLAVTSAMRSVIPARIVLTIQVVNENPSESTIGFANAAGAVLLARFDGAII